MKYKKDPYYQIADLRNALKADKDIFGEGFLELSEILKEIKTPLFEVGIDFGQRLDYLDSKFCKIDGGVEFNANFGLYKQDFKIFQRGWNIFFDNLDYWHPPKKEIVYCSNFLICVPEEYRKSVLNTLINISKELYLNEPKLTLDLEKRGNIYVNVNNEWRNDIKDVTERDFLKEQGFPDFKSLQLRLEKELYTDTNNASIPTNDTPSSI